MHAVVYGFLIILTIRLMAFADSAPLREWYLSYFRDGVARIDSAFEANESEVEVEVADCVKFRRARNISNSYYKGSTLVGILYAKCAT